MSVEDAIDNSGPYWKDRGYNASPVADIINPERAISPAYGSGRVGKRVDNKNGRRKLADIVKYTTKKQASARDTLLLKLASIEPDEDSEITQYDSIDDAVAGTADGEELIIPDGPYEATLPYDMYKECLVGFTDELVGLDKEAGLFDLAKRLAGRLGGAATAAKAPQSLLAKGLAAKAAKPASLMPRGMSSGIEAFKQQPRTAFQKGRLADAGDIKWRG